MTSSRLSSSISFTCRRLSRRTWTSFGVGTFAPTPTTRPAVRPRWRCLSDSSFCCGASSSFPSATCDTGRTLAFLLCMALCALLGGESRRVRGFGEMLALRMTSLSPSAKSFRSGTSSGSTGSGSRDDDLALDSSACVASSLLLFLPPAAAAAASFFFLRSSSSLLRSSPMFARSMSLCMVLVVTVTSSALLPAREKPIPRCWSSSGTSAMRRVTSRSSRLPSNRFLRLGRRSRGCGLRRRERIEE
mmetsp:Transcript_4101/g.7869  ORF Transcript_4101/g.7869 Transcript_4101/m.7869 type:complete len:246 (+) Transcript_4101:228-965(+)